MNDLSPTTLAAVWLAAGAFFLLLEAFGAPGVGLAFGGLGALVVGALLAFGWLDQTLLIQFGLWFVVTAAFAAILWKPLKRWRATPPSDGGYSNIVGDLAIVAGGDLLRGQTGQARWSGTLMQAEIDPVADTTRLADGEQAEISFVRGNILYLRPRFSRPVSESL